MSNKLENIWNNVSEGHRHLPRNKAVIKNENYLLSSLQSCNIDIKSLNRILDWGPGGGWLTKICSPLESFMFDIIPEHESIIKDNLPDIKIHFNLLKDDTFPKQILNNIDMAIVYSVLYHMPSIEYVKNVMNYICKHNITYIAIRNFFTNNESWDQTKSNIIYDNKTYIRGNLFNKKDFISFVENNKYKLIYDKEVMKPNMIHECDFENKAFSSCLIFEKI